jgi:hypothetical protein
VQVQSVGAKNPVNIPTIQSLLDMSLTLYMTVMGIVQTAIAARVVRDRKTIRV